MVHSCLIGGGLWCIGLTLELPGFLCQVTWWVVDGSTGVERNGLGGDIRGEGEGGEGKLGGTWLHGTGFGGIGPCLHGAGRGEVWREEGEA